MGDSSEINSKANTEKLPPIVWECPLLPIDAMNYKNQIGGHGVFGNKCGVLHSNKNKIVFKPVQKFPKGQHEVDFYQNLYAPDCNDFALLRLRSFVPTYHGLYRDSAHQTTFLGLSDLLAGMTKPCMCDLKMGQKTFRPDATLEKRMTEEMKYKWQFELGFSVSGIKSMLHKVIGSLIERVIGSYVEDVNSEKLSIGLLNGNLALSQLTLKPDTLCRLLDLPLVLVKGTIGKISVHIPYTHLWSQPWQLYIEDVELVASPSAGSSATVNRATQESNATQAGAPDSSSPVASSVDTGVKSDAQQVIDQKDYLARMEEKWWQTIHSTGVTDATALAAVAAMDSSSDTSSWWSYVASFGYGIVRGIQVEIHRVRLRIVQDADQEDASEAENVSDSFASTFGTFTILLDHLTVKTTLRESENKQDAEFKLVDVQNLCITWADDKAGARVPNDKNATAPGVDELLYVLPASSLSGQLRRRQAIPLRQAPHTPSNDYSHAASQLDSEVAQLEFEASLGDLKVQLSQQFCKATIQLAEVTNREFQLMQSRSRRPLVPVHGNTSKWWKYAAGELRPSLRPLLLTRTMRLISLTEMVSLAKNNPLYVEAYTAYLIRGLTQTATMGDESSSPSPPSVSKLMDHETGTLMPDTQLDDVRRRADVEWWVGRIAALRLVAMRRAASRLHKSLKPTRQRRITGSSRSLSESISPLTSIEGSEGSSTNPDPNSDDPTAIARSTTASSTMSWYAWWRYSSWLDVRSIWGPTSPPGSDPSLASSATEVPMTGANKPPTEAKASLQSAAATPSVRDAILELLDELAMQPDPSLSTGDTGMDNATAEVVVFRLVCRVDGFSIRLTDTHRMSSAVDYVHEAFIAVSGQHMLFTVDAEPLRRSLRFEACVESLTVRDERTMCLGKPDASHFPGGPLKFPLVLFPQMESKLNRPHHDASSLDMKMDPLHVVYQPELMDRVSTFLQTVASAASINLESSAMQQYEVIKERTQANLRALLDETRQPLEFNTSSIATKPTMLVGRVSSATKRPRRWFLALDILAPRLLLPDWHTNQPSNGSMQAIKALLCNFGHLKVSNWPVVERDPHQSSLRKGNEKYVDGPDGDDLFLTPCGTPTEGQSDVEDTDPVESSERRSNLTRRARHRPLYQSFIFQLEDLHMLVGSLEDLQKVSMWATEDPSGVDETLDQSVFSASTPQQPRTPTLGSVSGRLMTQLCLIDRLDVRLLVSRRLVSYRELMKLFNDGSPLDCPPSLWLTVTQERCVLQLSDRKMDCLMQCLRSNQSISTGTSGSGSKGPLSSPSKDAHQRPHSHRSRTNSAKSYSHRERSDRTVASEALTDVVLTAVQTTQSLQPRRKRLISTFRIRELIVQLESKGRPIAECRLQDMAGTWTRLTGRGAGYHGCVQLRALSIADALSNLGGDYDLIMAAHPGVRLNATGQLEVSDSLTRASRESSESLAPKIERDARDNLSRPPEGHAEPISNSTDNSGAALLQLYFDWTPQVNDHPASTGSSTIRGTQTFRLHLDCLDVVFNPNTLVEVQNCLLYLTDQLTQMLPTKPAQDPSGDTVSSAEHTRQTSGYDGIIRRAELTLTRLSVLALQVEPLAADVVSAAIANESATLEGYPTTRDKAERLAMLTLWGMRLTTELGPVSHHALQLTRLELSDLTSPCHTSTPGPIFTVGHIYSPSPNQIHSPSDGISINVSTQRFSHVKLDPRWLDTTTTTIRGNLCYPTVVHRPETIRRLVRWFHHLTPMPSTSTTSNTSSIPPVHEIIQWLKPIKLHFTIQKPLIALPLGSLSMISRLNHVTVCLGTDCLQQPLIRDGQYQQVRLTAEGIEVLACSTGKLFSTTNGLDLRLLHPMSGGKVPGHVESVLRETSVMLTITWLDSPTHLDPIWSDRLTITKLRAADLLAECPISPNEPSGDRECTPPPEAITTMEPHLLIDVEFSKPVRIKLAKPMLGQLVETFQPAAEPFDRPIHPRPETSMSLPCSTLTNPKPLVATHFALPSLQFDVMADLDIRPVPLARLLLDNLHLAGRLDSSNLSGQLTASAFTIQDCLPAEGGVRVKNERPILLTTQPSAGQRGASNVAHSRCRSTSCPDLDETCALSRVRDESSRSNGYGHCNPSKLVDALTLDQLPICNHCHKYAIHLQRPRVNQSAVEALRVSLLTVTDESNRSGVLKQFATTRRIIHIHCNHPLTVRFEPQSWVLLLDFLQPASSSHASMNLPAPPPPRSETTAQSTNIYSLTAHSIDVTVNAIRSMPGTNRRALLRLRAGPQVRLRLVDHVTDSFDWSTLDRQFIPTTLPVPFYLLHGELDCIELIACPTTDQCAGLYDHRLRAATKSTPHPMLQFQFARPLNPQPPAPSPLIGTRSDPVLAQLVSAQSNMAYVWARLSSLQFVHTQPLLTATIDSLMAFVDQAEFLARIRQSSHTLTPVHHCAPPSVGLLLDIVAQQPRLVIPVSALSRETLVVCMDQLSLSSQSPSFDDSSSQHQQWTDGLNDDPCGCPWCEGNKDGKRAEQADSGRVSSDDACFMDNIKLNLIKALVYHAERVPVNFEEIGTIQDMPEDCKPTLPASSREPSTICFPNYHLRASIAQRSHTHRPYLSDPVTLHWQLDRNRSSSQSHQQPDWRLVAPLTHCHVDLTSHLYRLIRGLLSHNLGGDSLYAGSGGGGGSTPPLIGWEPTAAVDRLMRRPVDRGAETGKLSSYPLKASIQTAITGVAWIAIAFEFPLEEVEFTFYTPPVTQSQRARPIVRFEFPKAHFAHRRLSDQRAVTRLQCTFISIVAISDDLPSVAETLIVSPASKPQSYNQPSRERHQFLFELTALPTPATKILVSLCSSRARYQRDCWLAVWDILSSPSLPIMDGWEAGLRSISNESVQSIPLEYAIHLRECVLLFIHPSLEPPHKNQSTSIQGSVYFSHRPDQLIDPLTTTTTTTHSLIPIHLCLRDLQLHCPPVEPCLSVRAVRVLLSGPLTDGTQPPVSPGAGSVAQPWLLHRGSHSINRNPLATVSDRSMLFGPSAMTLGTSYYRQTSRRVQFSLTCHSSRCSVALSNDTVKQLHSLVNSLLGTKATAQTDDDFDCSTSSVERDDDASDRKQSRASTEKLGLVDLVQLPERLADWISSDLISMELRLSLTMHWLGTESHAIFPLFELLAKRLNVSWRRSLPFPTGAIKVAGLTVNYFNRDLVAWEPALEPWSILSEWNQALVKDSTKITTVSISSAETLNVNLTIPLLLLLRRMALAEPEKPTESVDVETEKCDSDQLSNLQVTSSSDDAIPPTRTITARPVAPFRLANRTGCNLWFQVLPMDEDPTAADGNGGANFNDPTACASSAYPWHKIDSEAHVIDLPDVTGLETACSNGLPPSAMHSPVMLRRLQNPPKLLVQVHGWKTTYPITVDRLGVFFRTLERDESTEIPLPEDLPPSLASYLPAFTRLVIEIVQTNQHSAVQHLIILRSGLTVTNDLPDNHQLLIGFQLPRQQQHEKASTLCETDEGGQSLHHHPLLHIQSGQTAAVPLTMAAIASTGHGCLSFRPILVPISARGSSSITEAAAAVAWLPRGGGGGGGVPRQYISYEWAAVCLPDAVSITTPATGGASTHPDRLGQTGIPQPLTEIDMFKYLDWTRLKQPGDFLEAILTCRRALATQQVGLVGATLDESLNTQPTTHHQHPSTHRGASRGRRGFSPQYNFCMTIARDQFPPDPLWLGVPGWAVSRQSSSNDGVSLLEPKMLPGHHVTVGSLIRVTNLLPCDLTYYFADTAVRGALVPGEDVCIYELSPMDVLHFGVLLDGFPQCKPLSISPNSYRQKVLLRLQDTMGRLLELQVHVYSRAGSARHLIVSAAIWLINESGLPLVFSQSASIGTTMATSGTTSSSSTDSRSAIGSQRSSSGTQSPVLSTDRNYSTPRHLANVAAGQDEAHERARSLTPLLFSFANKQEGHLLRVRIGNGLRQSQSSAEDSSGQSESISLRPVWSPAISLEKTGVDMLQLKLLDSSNRPDLAYHVGVEVRPGQGRHAVTRVVTFRPRYVVENCSGLRIQVAQRRCVLTRAGDSAFVTLDHGCAQAFHWPRDDLDRLLCVRTIAATTMTTAGGGDGSCSSGTSSASFINTQWSGGFRIDRPVALTLMLRCKLPGLIPSGLHWTQAGVYLEPHSAQRKLNVVDYYMRRRLVTAGTMNRRIRKRMPDYYQPPQVRILASTIMAPSGGGRRDSLSELGRPPMDRLFMRVVVELRAATFHVLVQDANTLPPPFRMENATYVSLAFQQAALVSEGFESPRMPRVRRRSRTDSFSHMATVSPRPSPVTEASSTTSSSELDSKTQAWSGTGPGLSYLSPHTSVAYAVEEPQHPPTLTLSVPGGLNVSYDLKRLGLASPLVYDNFVYLTLLGPLSESRIPSQTPTRHDSFSSDLVFDVRPNSHRVTFSPKIPGRRAQLWWLSDSGHIYHEGSCSPLEPGARAKQYQQEQQQRRHPTSSSSSRQFVLDVDIRPDNQQLHANVDEGTCQQFEIAQLVVAPLSRRRKPYQTWRRDQHGLLMNSALFCVQVYRQPTSTVDRVDLSALTGTFVLAAKPRVNATRLISPSITPAVILPLWLRPGSGRLRVFLYLDGMTRVIRVEDEMDQTTASSLLSSEARIGLPTHGTTSRWSSAVLVDATPINLAPLPLATNRSGTQFLEDGEGLITSSNSITTTSKNLATNKNQAQFQLILTLPFGVGVSLVSIFAEELVYTSLFNLRLLICRAFSPDVFDSVDAGQSARSSLGSGAESQPPAGGLNAATDVLLDSGSDSREETVSEDPDATEEEEEEDQTASYRDSEEVSDGSQTTGAGWVSVEEEAKQQVVARDSLCDFVRLNVGHVQINSQFPGASLPVLLFTDLSEMEPVELVHTASSTSRSPRPPRHRPRVGQVVQGHPISSQPTSMSSSASRAQIAARRRHAASALVVAFQHEVQHRWKVHMFRSMEIHTSPVIIQAEELLLLKLIQFWQHCSASESLPSHRQQRSWMDDVDERIHPRPYNSAIAETGPLMWFDRFSINCIPLKLSVQTAKQSLTSSNLAGAKRILPSLMSFSNAEVQLDPLVRLHVLETGAYLLQRLLTHYQLQLRAHAVHIFGSVDFLGNPIGLIYDLTSGISGLVELDVGSLIRHVAHGLGDSTAKVAGSVSHLLNAISLDEQHQYERAAILGVRPETSSALLRPKQRQDSQSRKPLTGASSSSSTASTRRRDGDMDSVNSTTAMFEMPLQENLNDLELTHPSELMPALPVQSGGQAIAPLTAGFRGLMHGLVGGVTSMVTQPYRGIQEDQFKGFIYGVGRGLLGTVTKPLGGILDLVSGAMTSLTELTRSTTAGQPRRRRPRRPGLSPLALQPLSSYRLDEAVAQLQLHRLTLFTAVRGTTVRGGGATSSSQPTASSISTADWMEIGQEVQDGDLVNDGVDMIHSGDSSPSSSRTASQTVVSRLVHTTVDESWLRQTFYYPECVFHVLPVQESGVVVLVTDRAVWCVGSEALRGWVLARTEAGSLAGEEQSPDPTRSPITFYLTENATLLFMLPFHRLDRVSARREPNTFSRSDSSTHQSVYVIFTGDVGVSTQHLRCDYWPWAVRVARCVARAQSRFIQAALSLSRSPPPVQPTGGAPFHTTIAVSQRHGGIPLLPGHPFALAYAPMHRCD